MNRDNREIDFPEIVTLCGSTKFKDEFMRILRELTLEGKIVLMPGFFGHADGENSSNEENFAKIAKFSKRSLKEANSCCFRGCKICISIYSNFSEVKRKLDELHFRKIDLSDGIYTEVMLEKVRREK